MNLVYLEELLREKIENAVKLLKLKNKKGELVKIKTITGILPPQNLSKRDEEEEYPFIVVRLHKHKEEDEALATFKIIVAICAEGENAETRKKDFQTENYRQGHYDLVTIVEKIRQELLKDLRIGEGLIKKPFEAEIFLEQPFPYMYAEINIGVEFRGIPITQRL